MSIDALDLDSDESFVNLVDFPIIETTRWNGRDVKFSSILRERTQELFFQVLCDQKQTGVITFSAEVGSNEEKSVDSDAEKPYSNKEILTDVGMGIGSSALAGISAAGGLAGIPFAIVGVWEGAKSFEDAAKKYNENVRFEKEMAEQEADDYNRSHDHDSWDREY